MPDAPHSPYDSIPDFGLLYDSVPVYTNRPDVPFYVAEAAQVRGAVLEVGCGTGRITLPLARAGHAVVGIDVSDNMLARCREKLLSETAAVRERVTLRRGDMREIELGETFSLAIAPFRVMQHLTSIDEQIDFVARVAKHLAPGARFVFDVFRPDFARLTTHDGKEREDTPAQLLPDGRTLRRTYRIAGVQWLQQLSQVELVYYVAPGPGAREERFVHAFDMRWYLRDELIHLLDRSGFRVQTFFGDFERNPLNDTSPEMIVCAERR